MSEKIRVITKKSYLDLQKRVYLAEVIAKEVKGTIICMDFLIGDLNCPFHADDKSSMVFKNNKYYCFECEASGDAIQFLMCYKKMSFMEAVEYLANMFNVKLEYKEKRK